MSTHFLLDALLTDGFGPPAIFRPPIAPNPSVNKAKKMSTHFLSLINGFIWSNWGLGAQIHVETVLRK